jgi:hypothetical protein
MSDTVRTIIATPALLLGFLGFLLILAAVSDRSMVIGAGLVLAGFALFAAAAWNY